MGVDVLAASVLGTQFVTWADSFKSIGHPIRLAIMFLLLGDEVLHGKKSPTLTDMRSILGLPDTKIATSTLLYHVNELIKSDFVERVPLQEESGVSKVETVYHLSEKGWRFLNDFNLVQNMKKAFKSKS